MLEDGSNNMYLFPSISLRLVRQRGPHEAAGVLNRLRFLTCNQITSCMLGMAATTHLFSSMRICMALVGRGLHFDMVASEQRLCLGCIHAATLSTVHNWNTQMTC